MLSKKYYIGFVKIFNKRRVDNMLTDREVNIGKNLMRTYIIDDLINLFESDNPNFDTNKFINACNK